jgi:hypothetical protein
VQGKALATLAMFAFLTAAAAAGCGGGEASNPQSGDRTSSGSIQLPSQAPGTEAKDKEKSGEAEAKEDGKSSGQGAAPRESADGTTSQQARHAAPPVPHVEHHDSGGGSAQFATKAGDNSVQEFGQEAAGADFAQAASAFHAFLDARAAGTWDAACAQLSAKVVETLELLAKRSNDLEGAGCPQILAAVSAAGSRQALRAEAEAADVASLRVEGEKAFILYTLGSSDRPFALPMANEGGHWSVAGLAGTQLP